MLTNVAESPTAIWAVVRARDPSNTVSTGCLPVPRGDTRPTGKVDARRLSADSRAAAEEVGEEPAAVVHCCSTDSGQLQAEC